MTPSEKTPAKDYFESLKELRQATDAYLALTKDPALEALQEKESDLVRVVLLWTPLYRLAQAAYESAIQNGATIEEATQKAEEKKQELASRILEREAA